MKLLPFNFIQGFIEAVKVWQFTNEESMLTRFNNEDPGSSLFKKFVLN